MSKPNNVSVRRPQSRSGEIRHEPEWRGEKAWKGDLNHSVIKFICETCLARVSLAACSIRLSDVDHPQRKARTTVEHRFLMELFQFTPSGNYLRKVSYERLSAPARSMFMARCGHNKVKRREGKRQSLKLFFSPFCFNHDWVWGFLGRAWGGEKAKLIASCRMQCTRAASTTTRSRTSGSLSHAAAAI